MQDDRYKAAPYGGWIDPHGAIHFVDEGGHFDKLARLGIAPNQIGTILSLGWIRFVFIKPTKTIEVEHSSTRLPSDYQIRQLKRVGQDNGFDLIDNTTLNRVIGVYESDEVWSIYVHNIVNENKHKMPSWQDRYGQQ